MKCVTICAKTYEEAVQKARIQLSDSVRIHSRKDVLRHGGFLWLGKRALVEIVCYLPEAPLATVPIEESRLSSTKTRVEPESPAFEEASGVPEPAIDEITGDQKAGLPETGVIADAAVTVKSSVDTVEDRKAPQNPLAPLLVKAFQILKDNDFSQNFIHMVIGDLRNELTQSLPDIPSDEEFELMLVDRIVSCVEIDHQSQLHPPRIFVLLGPTGVGKTTTIAKIAALYGPQQLPAYQRKVRIITIDSFKMGAFEQISSFGEALGIPVATAATEEELYKALEDAQDADLVLIDTIGKSPRDTELAVKMKAMLSVPHKDQTGYYLALSSTMKEQDIQRTMDQYGSYGITSLIVTKTDETETIGNIVGICNTRHMPLLFFTDGQRVPKDIHKASASSLLSMLKGFSLDFANLWGTQMESPDGPPTN